MKIKRKQSREQKFIITIEYQLVRPVVAYREEVCNWVDFRKKKKIYNTIYRIIDKIFRKATVLGMRKGVSISVYPMNDTIKQGFNTVKTYPNVIVKLLEGYIGESEVYIHIIINRK